MARVRNKDIKLLDILREIQNLTPEMLGSIIYMLFSEDTTERATADLSASKSKKSILLVEQLIGLETKFTGENKKELVEQLRAQLEKEMKGILKEATSIKVDEILAKLEIVSYYLPDTNKLKNIVQALLSVINEMYVKYFTTDKKLASSTIRASKETIYKKLAAPSEDVVVLDAFVTSRVRSIFIKRAYDDLKAELIAYSSYQNDLQHKAFSKETKRMIQKKHQAVYHLIQPLMGKNSSELESTECEKRMKQTYEVLQQEGFIDQLTKSDKPAKRFINRIINLLNFVLNKSDKNIKPIKSKHGKALVASAQSFFAMAGVDKENKEDSMAAEKDDAKSSEKSAESKSAKSESSSSKSSSKKSSK